MEKKKRKPKGYWLREDHKRKAGGVLKSNRWAAWETKKMGKFGAASPCRRIDPNTGEYIAND